MEYEGKPPRVHVLFGVGASAGGSQVLPCQMGESTDVGSRALGKVNCIQTLWKNFDLTGEMNLSIALLCMCIHWY
jgi:hypothetical protein